MVTTSLEQQTLTAIAASDWAEVARLGDLLDAEDQQREARLNHPGSLLAAALWYAEQGIPTFPCAPGEKRPLTRHGFKDATTSPDQIRAWWDATPAANIGLACGHRFDVVDIDSGDGLRHFGREVIDTGNLGTILGLAFTPRGRHYYLPPDPDARNGVQVLPGVDTRATGGYVLAPPSRTPTGTYRWSLTHPLTLGAAT